MKRCPECRRDYYDETLLYCLDDGNALLEGPGSGSDPATAIIGAAESQRTGGPTDADTRIMEPGRGSPGRPLTEHKFLAAGISIVALVVLAGFGYGIYRLVSGDREQKVAQGTSVNLQIQRLTGD